MVNELNPVLYQLYHKDWHLVKSTNVYPSYPVLIKYACFDGDEAYDHGEKTFYHNTEFIQSGIGKCVHQAYPAVQAKDNLVSYTLPVNYTLPDKEIVSITHDF